MNKAQKMITLMLERKVENWAGLKKAWLDAGRPTAYQYKDPFLGTKSLAIVSQELPSTNSLDDLFEQQVNDDKKIYWDSQSEIHATPGLKTIEQTKIEIHFTREAKK